MKIKHPIDIKKGDLTYGQRIELGKILSDTEIGDFERFAQTIKCLYDERPKPIDAAKLLKEYERIVEGIRFWVEVETQALHYEPTSEELAAGINEYSKAVGELSTLHSIAKAFSQDPDVVYNWKYSKVFGILLNDLESYKYQQRLQKVHARKK